MAGALAVGRDALAWPPTSTAPPAKGPPADRLDYNVYQRNMSLHAHYFPGEGTGSKFQMMVRGKRRYLYSAYMNRSGAIKMRCLDVTDPTNARVVGEDLADGYQMQVAYNRAIGKWVLITSSNAGVTEVDMTRGRNLAAKGLRGVRIYDVSDPARAVLLSEWSTDQSDPRREVQEGTGAHRNFYTGGRYAYLDTSPDNSFANYPTARGNGVQVIDVLDPAKPKFVSNIWVPGQRIGEDAERAQWGLEGRQAFASLHGGFVVPENVEDGGRLGWGGWSALGVRVHDVSDPRKAREVGRWTSDETDPGISFHTVDVTRLNRGVVLVSPEALEPHCAGAWHSNFVLDARDPARLRTISKLPVPTPPDGAPYESFCQKRGRFGTHNTAHQKAPGAASPDFTCYTYFNGGLQCFDISNPAQPKLTAYFVPPQGGVLERPQSYLRDTDAVFVEWDRKLIWIGTSTGVYLLSTPGLGEPVLRPAAVRDWTLPALRRHWPKGEA